MAELTGNQLVIESEDGSIRITNSELYQENFSLEESICSEETLRFGGCESSCVKFKVANNYSALKNKWLKISIFIGEQSEETVLGVFKVESDQLDANRTCREVTAYDRMYTIANTDISDWHSGLIFPMTMKDFREQLFDFLECAQQEIDLPNDNQLVYATQSFEYLSAKDVLLDICEINGCFGKINENDVFEYIFLDETITREITRSEYKSGDFSYEDFATQKITGIRLVQSDTETEFDYNPDSENLYTIETRALYFGENLEFVGALLENLFGVISDITYIPASINCACDLTTRCGHRIGIYSDESIVKTYALERTLTGIQLLKESIEARGAELYDVLSQSTDRAIYYANKQITDIYKNNFYSYTFANAQRYSVTSVKQNIIEFNAAATANTDVILVATIPVEFSADGEFVIKYYVDAVEVENSELRQYMKKGMNFVTISNYFGMGENERISLTVSAETAYTESVERQQAAKILSFEKYIETGEYDEVAVDTTAPTGVIAQWGIKAVLFAKGIAGTENWDGTINLSEEIGLIPVGQPEIKALDVNMALNNLTPKTSAFGSVFSKVQVAQVEILGFAGNISFNRKITNYTFDTSKASAYEFDSEYLLAENGSYHMKTEYSFASVPMEIDSGSMCGLTLRTDDKSIVESVEIEYEL